MENQFKLESLIKSAKAGNKTAEAKFFSKLAVRFLVLVKRELQKNPIFSKQLNVEQKSSEVCRNAINEIKNNYPLTSAEWSLKRAITILHNIIDDFVTNTLTDFAKNGDKKAENLLFLIIRNKLMERITTKRWRVPNYEHKNQ